MMSRIEVIIPVEGVELLTDKMREIREWFKTTPVKGWKYDIPLSSDRFDIVISFPKNSADAAMLFKLSMK